MEGECDTRCRSSRTTSKLIAEIEELEHKSRRQDVLVDDELIYAFYDQLVPAGIFNGARFEKLVPRGVGASSRSCCILTRDELMRHEAAGITTASFPKTMTAGRRRVRADLPARAGRRADGVTRDGAAVRAEPGQRASAATGWCPAC